MKNFTVQFFMPAMIAALTTIIATSFTSYLLARPWCIQVEPGDEQRILYGQTNCVDRNSAWHHRPIVHGASINAETVNRYQ